VPQDRSIATRAKLLETAGSLIRSKGVIATRVEDVCELTGVTKGAFFHHFKTKEDLAESCLVEWRRSMSEMLANAPFQKIAKPKQRAIGCMDFFIQLFDNPATPKSCLVGTTIQEVSETHPQLRSAANQCFEHARGLFQGLLDEVCKAGRKRGVDTASLADLWIATIQGSLILYKASGDLSVIRKNLQHVKLYIAAQLPE